MKRIILVGIAFSVFLLLFSLNSGINAGVATETLAESKLKNTITRGNWNYISLELYDVPSGNTQLILEVLDRFEKGHKDLKIINWQIEYKASSYVSFPRTYGIWIQTEKR